LTLAVGFRGLSGTLRARIGEMAAYGAVVQSRTRRCT
jgi:hypothetical protein